MTDEEIKQNALAYAIENYGEYDEHDYTDHSGSNMCHAVSEKAFITGAHSRDEEIEELKKKLDDMTRLKNLFASSLDIYDRDNKKLQEELAELRNKKVE